jgi:hypothetical protein
MAKEQLHQWLEQLTVDRQHQSQPKIPVLFGFFPTGRKEKHNGHGFIIRIFVRLSLKRILEGFLFTYATQNQENSQEDMEFDIYHLALA